MVGLFPSPARVFVRCSGWMTDSSARHIVDEDPRDRASYLTVRRGDHVYDLYGWAAGRVVEPRVVNTRDEHFDGLVVDFRGRRVFVDAPEVKAIHEGVVVLAVTVADLARAASDRTGRPLRATGRLQPDDAVALLASVSRMYAADRVTLATLERDVERILTSETCEDLDSIAGEAARRRSRLVERGLSALTGRIAGSPRPVRSPARRRLAPRARARPTAGLGGRSRRPRRSVRRRRPRT